MHDDLRDKIRTLFPAIQRHLEDLIRIPSISAPIGDPAEVRRSAERVAEMLTSHRFQDVQLLEVEGSHPAVFGQIPGPEGAPTVLLYAHHDVQPVGEGWTMEPFEPTVIGGRLYARGSSDDKCGIVMHLAAVAAHGFEPPVTVKVFAEGEEEIGSAHLSEYLDRYGELLAADVIVIADAGNWRVGVPAFTTSLRGLVDCTVEVSTLQAAVHSGMWGGTVIDALTALARLLATLHDDHGNVAIAGLVEAELDDLDLTEAEMRETAGVLDGVELIGEGSLTDRMWARPAVSVLAIDAPPVSGAINALIPTARAKVSLRIAPGQDPAAAMDALAAHLESNAPWGAQVTVTKGSGGNAFHLDTSGPAYRAYEQAFEAAWERPAVQMGVGGSIPFVADFAEAYPRADIVLTGAADMGSRAHGPDESVSLDDFERACVAEAIALRLLAEG